MTTSDHRRTWLISSAADFGRTIADLRSLRGLTQAELAEQNGLTRNYVARLEAGLSVVMVDRVLRLLRRLGAEVTVALPQQDDPRA